MEYPANGTIFHPSGVETLNFTAQRFMPKGDERVCDLGSGNAVAVAVFSLFAGFVTGIESDPGLFAAGKRCISELHFKGL